MFVLMNLHFDRVSCQIASWLVTYSRRLITIKPSKAELIVCFIKHSYAF